MLLQIWDALQEFFTKGLHSYTNADVMGILTLHHGYTRATWES
jgi:hypothetical protein